MLVLVSSTALEQMRRQIERLISAIGAQPTNSQETGPDYVEPGPRSPRKYFTPEELMERWGWGKTKVYEIPEFELPYWKKGQLKRYFWAHVWAYEGRITREQADAFYALQEAELEILSHPPAKLTRLR